MTICPCCGFRFEGNLRNGCKSCGACSVGDPLPKPEHELPAYGRPLVLVAMGTLMVLGLLAETIIALAERTPFSFSFWSWVAAGETAAWRLKWIAVPVMFIALWGGRRIYRSMLKTQARFVGLAMARRGLLASALVALTFVTLIGVTVPARLRQREMGIEATRNARAYTVGRAEVQYEAAFGMIATTLDDLRKLPDPDGSIAEALANIDATGYRTTADVAVVKPNKRTRAGAVLVNASVNSITNEDPSVGGLSFTSYELRLPGADKIQDTDDDMILRDGVIMTVAEAKQTSKPAAATARARKK